MKLHYVRQGSGPTVIFLHGLFGSLDNLKTLASSLSSTHEAILLDLPNHGLSPFSTEISYISMAIAVQQLIQTLSLKNVTLIGHSMGGKVAMQLTALDPTNIKQLVILDIAPVTYYERPLEPVLAAIQAVNTQVPTTKNNAANILRHHHLEAHTTAFLLKSFREGKWLFNAADLCSNYDEILSWQVLPAWDGSTLFVSGSLSSYIQTDYISDIQQQFPNAKGHIIHNAGHWVHADKFSETLRVIQRFLNSSTT